MAVLFSIPRGMIISMVVVRVRLKLKNAESIMFKPDIAL